MNITDDTVRAVQLAQWADNTQRAVRAYAANRADLYQRLVLRDDLGVALVKAGVTYEHVSLNGLRDVGLVREADAHAALRFGIELGVIEPEPDDEGHYALIVDF
jgi:hypothetical protein